MEDNEKKMIIPQKILMTTDNVGGVWTYSIDLIRALEKFNIQIELATIGEPLDKHQRAEVETLKFCNVHESPFRLEWMDNSWNHVEQAGHWLEELNSQLLPDLVHLNNYCYGSIQWYVPSLIFCHSCVLSCWKAVKNEDDPEKYDVYHDRVKKGLKAADVVIAPTQSMLDMAVLNCGPLQNTHVIFNARERTGFKSGPKKNQIFSMVRIWDEAKNMKALLNVASELSWPVLIAGQDNLKGKVLELDLQNAYYLGKLDQEQIKKILSETSIYVMPAKYEPFGLSILEAAFSGCALILGNIQSLKEVWGDAAIYVNPQDPQDLYTKINMLIEDEPLRKKMSIKAYTRASTFSINKMASEYVSMYSMLLKQREAVV